MRKLFLQFYLTVVTSFLFSVLVVGAIYKNVVQNTTQRYLVDIFETSLYLIERELSDYPEAEWEDALNNIRSRIPLPVEIEPLDTFVLSPANQKALQEGSIIRLEDSNLFLQRIPHSDYLVAMGPVSYFHYVGTLQWIDVLAVLSLCLSLGIPTYLWIRPLWKHARELSQVSQKLGNGDFAARASLPEASALVDLGKTMNGMAGDIEELLASRKVMINAVSHDLRTPIARLRYRLEMLKGLSEDNPMTDKVIGQINRELDQLNDMTDELLLLARDRTIFQLQEFKWTYMNGILTRWYKEGLTTVEAVEASERKNRRPQYPRATPQPAQGAQPLPSDDIGRMIEQARRAAAAKEG
mgnify:CR=1 FL=1